MNKIDALQVGRLVELGQTNFVGTNLQGLNLSSRILIEVDFEDANLIGSDLSRSFLTRARLKKTCLNWANLRYVKCSEGLFSRSDLSLIHI